MSDTQDALYLVAYDIADTKRLAKVHNNIKETRDASTVFGFYCRAKA